MLIATNCLSTLARRYPARSSRQAARCEPPRRARRLPSSLPTALDFHWYICPWTAPRPADEPEYNKSVMFLSRGCNAERLPSSAVELTPEGATRRSSREELRRCPTPIESLEIIG